MSFRERKQCPKCGCNYVLDFYSVAKVAVRAAELKCPNCQSEMDFVDIGIYEKGSDHVYRRKGNSRRKAVHARC
jgi:ribosomal protein S27AE